MPIEPIFESINEDVPENNPIEIEKESIKKEDIIPYLNRKIERNREKENNFSYSLFEILNYLACGKRNEKNKDKIMDFFFKKITKKFNVFYYLKQMKTLKIFRKSVLKNGETKLISLVSNKEYNATTMKEKKNLHNEKEKNFIHF